MSSVSLIQAASYSSSSELWIAPKVLLPLNYIQGFVSLLLLLLLFYSNLQPKHSARFLFKQLFSVHLHYVTSFSEVCGLAIKDFSIWHQIRTMNLPHGHHSAYHKDSIQIGIIIQLLFYIPESIKMQKNID